MDNGLMTLNVYVQKGLCDTGQHQTMPENQFVAIRKVLLQALVDTIMVSKERVGFILH